MTLQQQIIKALGAKPQINAEEEIRRSVDFLKSYLQTYPFIKSLVLGISGGQDLSKWVKISLANIKKASVLYCNRRWGYQADIQRATATNILAAMPLI